jgi:hypothetical protein
MYLKLLYCRPVPKFLCVKGILFFSFWQSVGISALVAARVITRLGPYTHPENVSVGLNDLLICIEMPFFAIAHNYAFSYHDFIDANHSFVARMPMYYAFRDAFGARDVVEDSKATLRGEGMDYREFEPAEGLMHQGVGLENRIRAGLRYSRGGRKKYWLPKTADRSRQPGRAERVVNKAIRNVTSDGVVHAPLLENQAEDVVHLAPDMVDDGEETTWDFEREFSEEGYELPFGDVDETDEELFDHSKKYLFGDYNYPTIDVSSESARITIWAEEERVLRDERGAWFSPIRGSKGVEAMRQREGFSWQGYGAVGSSSTKPIPPPSSHEGKRPATFYGEAVEERLIDHEQERMTAAAADSKDVVMKWTRIQRDDKSGGSQSRTTSYTGNNQSKARAQAARSSPGSSPHVRSSPVASRTNSRSGAVPDAVDLVVEESRADEVERRKAEPSIRGSVLKKVYRREYVTGGEDDEGVEVVKPQEEVIVTTKSEPNSTAEQRTQDGNKPYEWTNVVQRDGPTTPRSGHLQPYRYDDIPDDHNPWA